MPNEADTCRRFVVPALTQAGWDTAPHAIGEQRTITDGRILPVGKGFLRKPPKRVDYLLFYTRDIPLAVVEAKASEKHVAEGMQQAKDYAALLGLRFAYATNGREILEYDGFLGTEKSVERYPTPKELWERYRAGAGLQDDAKAEKLLVPGNHAVDKNARYYQQIAIQRAIESVLRGDRRILLTMATGTGKTFVAFQICWRLWNARWNIRGEHRKPRILFLADRNILVDDPKDKMFRPFGDARFKIENGEVVKSREMYFAIYQAMAEDETRKGLYREFAPDFFDLILVDECHRGSSHSKGSWREILNWFQPAVQIGLTATPLREDNRDSYLYFGNPIYQYSLRQGIEDGFLAPYRVHRVVSEWDAAGWRPSKDQLDRYGRPVPDEEYQTKDFERVVALRARTKAIARHLSDFLRRTSTQDKTLVFCVDQEHALEMRAALIELNPDLVAANPNWVCRVTSDEKEIGRGHLSAFQDVETKPTTPVVLTTSQMLTTGVDAPTVKNVVLVRVVGAMSEFKQIIGRGTRVRDDYDKLWFNILDYTGCATRMFADPDFDGDPAHVTEEEMDQAGKVELPPPDELDDPAVFAGSEGMTAVRSLVPEDSGSARKFYVDGGEVRIAAHLVYELDSDGKQLQVVQYTDYAAQKVRSLCPNSRVLRERWVDPRLRTETIERLSEQGIDFEQLAETANQPDADPFDLLCHLAFNAPLRTRRERAQRLRTERADFFERYAPEARRILEELLDKYTEHGFAQFVLPDILQVPPISTHGQTGEIIELFGGPAPLRQAVTDLQNLLYAA
ncbi:MAG TPA: DEAD/DEAH box helicase family protein [Fibrobacteria bacterium]|nr:DEAD/DEAH box helicase family protein [Fibrobacteria bacterium]